ncbi:acyltransferase family protein [Microbacterium sp. G2-8]|uniref:acyltransferase family protein n=1 Tax=Microbacterium sp. G2-8 TaxID=2842454 RepID=UPI001C8AE492|nr:acyltransferase family protein [Microbacterium sp. G2-8]
MEIRATRASQARARIGEIDGLRGIALTLVVVFHLFGHGRVSGGVDVFLTVSGFLLVLSLGRALDAGRPLGIFSRWGRTFARLAPPAALVLVTVTALAFTVYSPWLLEQNLIEVVSAALYVENWQLITSQLAYGAAGPDTSPVQHFWSLSVQAQFFLVFPLLVAMLTLVVRARRARVIAFWSLLAGATVWSFIYAWRANMADPQVAYFDTFARFWELGIGGLLAGVVLTRRSLPAPAKPLTGWAGLAMIIASGFIFDGGAMYPGPAALLPVGGALLVILSTAGGPLSPSRMLTSGPLRWLDRISYGLYLWHWPLLIVVLTVTQRDVIGWGGALVVLGSALVATLLTRWLLRAPMAWATNPRPMRSISLAVVAILVAAVPAGALYTQSTVRSDPVAVDDCAGAATLDPARPDCADQTFDGELQPALEDLRRDDANRAECWAGLEADTVEICALGEEQKYTKRILAVGDSHNNVFIDVYEEIAEARGWRIDAAGRAGCAWVAPETPIYGQTEAAQRACVDWRKEIDERAASGDYDAIFTTASSKSTFKPVEPGQTGEEYHARVLMQAWSNRASEETPILALRDNPIFPKEMLECLADRAAIDGGKCALPRSRALLDTGVDEAVRATQNAHLIDLSDLECALDTCSMVQGGIVVTRDGGHLTRTYAATLAPYLDREMARRID